MTNRTIFPGFKPDEINENDYVLGGVTKLPKIILCPERDWTPYLPELEVQYNSLFDTYSCTNFSNCNCFETIWKRLFNETINKSDRYSANISGTKPGEGNSHNNVAEKTRINGFISEELYPFTQIMTQSEFFTMPGTSLLDIGKKLVEKEIIYLYEKVNREDFLEALLYSPIQVAVDSQTTETKSFEKYDHSAMLYGWNAEKKVWKIFDTYFGRKLEYPEDYPFGFGMRFHVEKRQVVDNDSSPSNSTSISKFIKWLLSIISRG